MREFDTFGPFVTMRRRPVALAVRRASARRIAAALNAFAGVPIDEIRPPSEAAAATVDSVRVSLRNLDSILSKGLDDA